MSIPSSAFEIVALIALAIPGLSYLVVSMRQRGTYTRDKDLADRLSSAIFVSVLIDAIYFIVFGSGLISNLKFGASGSVEVHDPVSLAWAVLVFANVLPSIAAFVVHFPLSDAKSDWRAALGAALKGLPFNPIPSAWDFGNRAMQDGEHFVRVLKGGNRWVGGRYGFGSALSGYPEPHDLYIIDQFTMGVDGSFGESVPANHGVWLLIEDGDVVEWLYGTSEEPDAQGA